MKEEPLYPPSCPPPLYESLHVITQPEVRLESDPLLKNNNSKGTLRQCV
jgi:hypothetical protein